MFTSEIMVSNLLSLAQDIERLGTPDYIRSLRPEATISRWYLTPSEVFTLRGEVSGHPDLQNGPIETSQLFFMDQKFGLARTLSRWYRLGVPLDLGLNRTRQ